MPSVASAGSRDALPVRLLPVCVSVHLNVSGPCASVPVPIHVPERLSEEPAGELGAPGEAGDDTHPVAVTMRSAAMNRVFTSTPSPPHIHRRHVDLCDVLQTSDFTLQTSDFKLESFKT